MIVAWLIIPPLLIIFIIFMLYLVNRTSATSRGAIPTEVRVLIGIAFLCIFLSSAILWCIRAKVYNESIVLSNRFNDLVVESFGEQGIPSVKFYDHSRYIKTSSKIIKESIIWNSYLLFFGLYFSVVPIVQLKRGK